MKKDRNCMTPYYGMPNAVQMPMPLPMPTVTTYMGGNGYNNTDLSTLSNQVNSLEQRVSNLEQIVGKNYTTNSSSYNSTNYQMM